MSINVYKNPAVEWVIRAGFGAPLGAFGPTKNANRPVTSLDPPHRLIDVSKNHFERSFK